MKKNIISILLILVLIICIIIGMNFLQNYILKNTEIKQNEEIDKLEKTEVEEQKSKQESVVVVLENKENSKVNMSVIGDIMCHNSQYKDAYKNGTYDFSYVFEDVKTYIENSDIAVGNLETTFAGREKGYSSYPTFNTPEILAQNLKDLGIDILSTANNHSLDTGYYGIESTIDYLDNAEIEHIGTFKSEEEKNKILIKEITGIKIAFLAYTYGTNGIPIPKGKEYCINLIDKELIASHLEIAKKESPDVICVNMHWGTEYQTLPNNEQIELSNFLFENGVDIILGSHPHVLQPMENKTITLPDGTQKNVFIIYSLGNFMSGQVKENTRSSIILNFDIIKNGITEKISIENVSYVPIYTFTSPNFKNYKVLDIQKAISKYESKEDISIGEDYYNLLRNGLNTIYSSLNF